MREARLALSPRPSLPAFWDRITNPIYAVLFLGDKNLFRRATDVRSKQGLTTRDSIADLSPSNRRKPCLEIFSLGVSNFLAIDFDRHYLPLAQIRTCLWPCVDR